MKLASDQRNVRQYFYYDFITIINYVKPLQNQWDL